MASVNIGFVAGQLNSAILKNKPDLQRKWTDVLLGIETSQLNIGSRTPVPDTPAWVTLDVLQGGFASGRFQAGDGLLDYEKEKYLALTGEEAKDDATVRQRLNTYFLNDGMPELLGMLSSTRYRIKWPEEGVLLTVAWLISKERVDEASSLVKEVAPWFSRLRFYPEPSNSPLEIGEAYYTTVEDILERMRYVGRREVDADNMLAHVDAWRPLTEEMVILILDTFPPDNRDQFVSNVDSWKDVLSQLGSQVTDTWKSKARDILKRVETALKKYGRYKRTSFRDYVKFIEHALNGTLSISTKNHTIQLLVGFSKRRGLPGTSRYAESTQKTCSQIEAFKKRDKRAVARILVPQLEEAGSLVLYKDIYDHFLDIVAREIDDNAAKLAAPILQQCTYSSFSFIVEKVVPSAEACARVISQETAKIKSMVSDPQLRILSYAEYLAFRNRRSLLLFNLERQVLYEELPWVEYYTAGNTEETAFNKLQQVVHCILKKFPYTILPNKVIQELNALVKLANRQIPLTEELAADIFMGTVSPKFVKAAQISLESMRNTEYSKYFELNDMNIANVDDLMMKAKQRLGPRDYNRSPVAYNGMVIEQIQVITTHNLAQLWFELRLDFSPEDIVAMCKKCIDYIAKIQPGVGHRRLIARKNTAYAFRQLMFFVSWLKNKQEVFEYLTKEGSSAAFKVTESKIFYGWL